MNASILTSASRVIWLALAHRVVLDLQRLEQQISIAMGDRPTSAQAIALMQADQHLGEAARAVTEAASKIRSL
jgi:hypothetical protein